MFVLFADYKDEDVARSLLLSISNDIGQLACLYARLHELKKIYFGGYFIRGHHLTMHTISFAINYWSKVQFSIISRFMQVIESFDW